MPPTIFISYSRNDESEVKVLAQGLQAAQRNTWLDQALGGGDSWWNAILAQIRDAAVFIFAISDDSLKSKPCRSELDYAKALGIPIVPVQVGKIESYRTDLIFELQSIDYCTPSASAAFALIAAVESALQKPRIPVSPPPAPPSMPYEYMLRLSSAVDADYLSPDDQRNVVAQLRRALEEESDTSVRRDITRILRNLYSKPFVTLFSAREIESILRDMENEAPSWPSRSSAAHAPGQGQPSSQQSGHEPEHRSHEMEPPASRVEHQVNRSMGRPASIKIAAFCWIAAAIVDLTSTTVNYAWLGSLVAVSGDQVAFMFLYFAADILTMIFAGRMLDKQSWARTALVITSATMMVFTLVSFNSIAQLFEIGYTGMAAVGLLLAVAYIGLISIATAFAYRPPSSAFLK